MEHLENSDERVEGLPSLPTTMEHLGYPQWL